MLTFFVIKRKKTFKIEKEMVCKDISRYVGSYNLLNQQCLFRSLLQNSNKNASYYESIYYEHFCVDKYFFYAILKLRASEKTLEKLIKRHLFQIVKYDLGRQGMDLLENPFAFSNFFHHKSKCCIRAGNNLREKPFDQIINC